jgi:diacylglycerol kinase family enzyme
MNCYFIANPHARNGCTREKIDRLRTELSRRNLRYEFAFCRNMDQARDLSRQANLSGFDVITAVGGDGTINRVLNGFFDQSGRRLSQAKMGAVHIGTSPDFCRSYGVPLGLGPAADALALAHSRPISVGQVTCELSSQGATDQGPGTAYFACCANIGLGAALARLANAGVRKRLGDVAGTFVSLLRVLRRYQPRDLQAELDGQPRSLAGVYNVAVGKTFHVASGLKIRNELSDRDSRFYVLCLRNLSWRNLPVLLGALYRGRPIKSNSWLTFEYARTVRLEPVQGAVEVEFDGDPAGRCPCRIETAPEPLDLIVGESA